MTISIVDTKLQNEIFEKLTIIRDKLFKRFKESFPENLHNYYVFETKFENEHVNFKVGFHYGSNKTIGIKFENMEITCITGYDDDDILTMCNVQCRDEPNDFFVGFPISDTDLRYHSQFKQNQSIIVNTINNLYQCVTTQTFNVRRHER